jgi:hypothetical protein
MNVDAQIKELNETEINAVAGGMNISNSEASNNVEDWRYRCQGFQAGGGRWSNLFEGVHLSMV